MIGFTKKVVATNFPDPYIVDVIAFGAAVRAARTSTSMTIFEASLCLGVSKQTIQDLELGTGTVGLGLALKIAHGLGVSVFAIPSKNRINLNRMIQQLDEGR